MSVAKRRRQFVIFKQLAALAGRPADWRETRFIGETAAFSYRVDRRHCAKVPRWDYSPEVFWQVAEIRNPVRLTHKREVGSGRVRRFPIPACRQSARSAGT
jgi:hypothetical protein